MLFGLIMLGIGLGMMTLAFFSWRRRHEEMISVLEAAILKATGAEPLPLTKLDHILQRMQIVFMAVFGAAAALVGGLFVFGELFE